MAQEGMTRWQRIQAVSRKNRYQNSLFICLLALAFAGVFVVLTILSPASSGKEKEAPGLSAKTLLDGSWSAGVEEGFRDSFAGQARWLRTGLVMSRVFGAEENGGVYLGADGYLFEKPAERGVNYGLRCVRALNGFAAAHPDLRVAVLAVPDAWTVLTEKLPEGAVVPDQAAQLDRMAEEADGVAVLNVTEALQACQSEPLYYRTDTHLTAVGARQVLTAAAEALGIAPADCQVYVVSDAFTGPLAAESGNVDTMDMIRVCVPQSDVKYKVVDPETGAVGTTLFSAEALDTEQPLDLFLGGGRARLEIVTTADTGRKLLIIGDDWARCFLPLLTPYFEEILYLEPASGAFDAEATVSTEGFTDLLYLCSLEHFLDGSLSPSFVSGAIE